MFQKIVTQIESIDREWFAFGNSNFHNTRFCSPAEEHTLKDFSNENHKHIEDAIILLTARHRKLILVSDDNGTPFKRAKKQGYTILSFQRFLDQFN